jgi:L-threonylcarbamoyladenylate synthase
MTIQDHLRIPGEIAVIPTDTVYGVVARAADEKAVARLYHLKRREKKPGTLVAANVDQLIELGFKESSLDIAKQFWPGAVSVIIEVGPELDYIHQGVGSLAVRIPNDSWLVRLLEHIGPLVTSSANQPGQTPATTVAGAKEYFGDDVSWYEDGGVVDRDPSTVIRVVDGNIEVIRPGTVSIGSILR